MQLQVSVIIEGMVDRKEGCGCGATGGEMGGGNGSVRWGGGQQRGRDRDGEMRRGRSSGKGREWGGEMGRVRLGGGNGRRRGQ